MIRPVNHSLAIYCEGQARTSGDGIGHLYLGVGEEGPRLFWEQDITVFSSNTAQATKYTKTILGGENHVR